MRRYFFLGIFIVFVSFLFAGCRLQNDTSVVSYFPDTVSFVATYTGFSAEEKRLFAKHVSKFPSELQAFLVDLPSEFLRQLALTDISPSQDFAPLFLEPYELAVASAPPVFYLALSVSDRTALDSLRAKLVNFSERTHAGVSYLVQDAPGISTAFFDNVLFATSTEEAMKEAISAQQKKKTISRVSRYRALRKRTDDSPLSFYVFYQQENEEKTAPLLEAASATISFETDGVRFHNYSLSDDIDFAKIPEGDLRFISDVPAQSLLFYIEGGDMVQTLGPALSLALAQQSNVQQFLERGKTMLALAGLSFEDDVQPWFDTYGLAFYTTSNALPGFILFFDASNHKDSADKTLRVISSFAAQLPVLAGQNLPLLYDTVEIGGNSFSHLSFDVKSFIEKSGEALSSQQRVFLQSFSSGLELFFGRTADGKVLFALHPAFDELYGRSSLAKDEFFQKAREAVSGYKRGIVYVYPKAFSNFLNIFSPAASAEQLKRMEMFARVQRFLEPMESFVSSSRPLSKHELETVAFLRLP